MLDKERRLRKGKDFERVYKRGKKAFGRYVILFFVETGRSNNRYGLVANRKLGKAVRRNKCRRRVGEVVRAYDSRLRKAYDMVILIRPMGSKAGFGELRKDLAGTFKRAGLYL